MDTESNLWNMINRHREETAPLFGTGDITLTDPESLEPTPKEKPETKSSEEDDEEDNPFAKNYKYGSIADDEDEEGAQNTTTVRMSNKSSGVDADENESRSTVADPMPYMPRYNPCLWIFHLLEGVAVVTALCLLTTQVLPLFMVPRAQIMDDIGVLSLALKVYISMFCFMFIIVETDLPVPLIRSSPLLQTYTSRGFIYSFLGLICVEESYSERVKDILAHGKDSFHVGWAAIFMQISSWVMLSIGVIYMMLGVCCLKRLRDRLKQQEIDAWKKYREETRAWKARQK